MFDYKETCLFSINGKRWAEIKSSLHLPLDVHLSCCFSLLRQIVFCWTTSSTELQLLTTQPILPPSGDTAVYSLVYFVWAARRRASKVNNLRWSLTSEGRKRTFSSWSSEGTERSSGLWGSTFRMTWAGAGTPAPTEAAAVLLPLLHREQTHCFWGRKQLRRVDTVTHKSSPPSAPPKDLRTLDIIRLSCCLQAQVSDQ